MIFSKFDIVKQGDYKCFMDFLFTMPQENKKQRDALQALAKLLQAQTTSSELILGEATGGHQIIIKPNKIPKFSPPSREASFSIANGATIMTFNKLSKSGWLSNLIQRASLFHRPTLAFTKAVQRLSGHVQHIDHIGINVASDMKAEIWMQMMQMVAKGGQLYEYPHGVDGYDRDQNLWYFAVSDNPDTPKFEFVFDQGNKTTFVQLDIKTNLTREQAAELLPEGFKIPGLEDAFRSVWVKTPWPGMRKIRLDIRFAGDADDFETGQLFRGQFQPVSLDRVRAPKFVNG